MKKAFTLIELLVVIAIIAILAAILFPVFAQAKVAAKKTADLSNVKQMMTSALMYANDYDDLLNPLPYDPGPTSPQRLWWTDQLFPYVKSKPFFSNPGNSDPIYSPPAGYRYPGTTEDNATPAQIIAQGYRNTQAINGVVARSDTAPGDFVAPLSTTATDQPAQIAYIGPGQNWFTWYSCQLDSPGSSQVDLFWDISAPGGAAGSYGWGYEYWGMGNTDDVTKGGFNGGANFSYLDGHAKFDKAVAGGDLNSPFPGPGDLYSGYFPHAKIANAVGNAGAASCPTNLCTVEGGTHC